MLTIRFIIDRVDTTWIAQGLEQDLVAEAATLDELEVQVNDMVACYLYGCDLQGARYFGMDPGPEEARTAFHQAQFTFVPSRPSVPGVRIEMRIGEVERMALWEEIARGRVNPREL